MNDQPDVSQEIIVGLDIGGTKTAVLLVNRQGQQLSFFACPTVTTTPQGLVAGVVGAVDKALELACVKASQIVGVGVAVPGLVNPVTGIVEIAVNLNLRSYPLGQALSVELGSPAFLENDVRTAALGAYQFVKQKEPVQHLAYLSVGTGIAAGVILQGQLYRGAHGMAGEIGHVIFEPDGPACGCDMPGCLEAVASGSAIARMARELIPKDDEPITAEKVYQAAANGQEIACSIVHKVSNYLARAIQLLIMTYDVERVVLGGGVTKSGATFFNPILEELARLRSLSSLADSMLKAEKLILLPATFNAGTWGAINLALPSLAL
ncbi:MAG: ROK family protein [Chloroflexota bacterium]|jgi:glucokinase